MATQLTNFTGIKISDLASDPNFTSARLALSGDAATGDLYKVTIEQWVTLIGLNNPEFKGTAVPTDDPGDQTDAAYWIVSEAGTYTNFGGVVVPASSLAILAWNGSNWVSSITTIPVPENKIEDWAAGSYSTGEQVNHNGQIWQANATIESTDVPGVSDKWDAVIAALMTADYVKASANLIDNSKVISGGYNSSDGTSFSTTDGIRTPLIKIDATEGTISLSGLGATINSWAARIAFYDASKAYISYSNALTNITIPGTAAYMAITIAYATGIGSDPTNSPYADTMMANYGETSIAYVPYDVGIDAARINAETLNTSIISNDSVSGLLSFMGGVQYVSNNIFDKTKAGAGPLGSTGQTVANNNWVHSGYTPVDPNTEYSASGYMAVNAPTSMAMAFYDSSKTFISGVALSGQTSYTQTSPSNAAYLRCTIANVVNIGLTPTDNSYVNAFMVNKGEVMVWEPGPDQHFIDAERIQGLESSYSEVYVSLNPTGYSGKELFVIYVKREGNGSHYVGIQLGHAYDMSDIVYSDQWRIITANEFTFDGSTMIQTDTGTIANGESECVFMPINRTYTKSNFAGGWHGNEIYSKFKLFIDGVPLTSLTTAFTLRACENASYIQYSQIHEPPDLIDGVETPVAGHPVECDHIKHTIFGSGGYTTINTLVWAGNKPNFWYHGICCVGKNQALNGFDEDFSEYVYTGTLESATSKVGNRAYFYYNTTNKLGANVTSTLIAKSEDDLSCTLFVQDRGVDSKYYRRTPDNDSTAENEVYKSTMTVIFKQEAQ